MAGFANATTGVAVKVPHYNTFDWGKDRTAKPVDGAVVDKAGNRHEIGDCGHWLQAGHCRHGCTP